MEIFKYIQEQRKQYTQFSMSPLSSSTTQKKLDFFFYSSRLPFPVSDGCETNPRFDMITAVRITVLSFQKEELLV